MATSSCSLGFDRYSTALHKANTALALYHGLLHSKADHVSLSLLAREYHQHTQLPHVSIVYRNTSQAVWCLCHKPLSNCLSNAIIIMKYLSCSHL